MEVGFLAPAGLPFTLTINHNEKDIHLLTTIGTATIEITKVYQSSVALVANTSNWRKVAKDLIGDEPVTYEEKSKKDTLRKFPIVNIFSTDPEALKRVQSKAAEVE